MTLLETPTVEALLGEWLESIEGDLVAPVEAQKFVAQLRERHPALLADWLDAHAETILCDRIGRLLGSQRATAQRRKGPRTFAAYADALERGEEPASILEVRYVVDDELTRRPLRAMTAADLDYAIADYESSAKAARFEASFLKAIKKALPDPTSTVGDVLSEADVARLRFTKAR